MKVQIEDVEKVYAVLMIKHPDNTGEIHLIKAPESITDNVRKLSLVYPESRIRVFERGYQADYFSEKDRMW